MVALKKYPNRINLVLAAYTSNLSFFMTNECTEILLLKSFNETLYRQNQFVFVRKPLSMQWFMEFYVLCCFQILLTDVSYCHYNEIIVA